MRWSSCCVACFEADEQHRRDILHCQDFSGRLWVKEKAVWVMGGHPSSESNRTRQVGFASFRKPLSGHAKRFVGHSPRGIAATELYAVRANKVGEV